MRAVKTLTLNQRRQKVLEVHSDDYVLKEYGLTPIRADKVLRRAEGAIAKDRRAGRLRTYDGDLRRSLGG